MNREAAVPAKAFAGLRSRGEQWFSEYIQGPAGVISLASVGIEISMSDLYEGFVFPEDEEVPAP